MFPKWQFSRFFNSLPSQQIFDALKRECTWFFCVWSKQHAQRSRDVKRVKRERTSEFWYCSGLLLCLLHTRSTTQINVHGETIRPRKGRKIKLAQQSISLKARLHTEICAWQFISELRRKLGEKSKEHVEKRRNRNLRSAHLQLPAFNITWRVNRSEAELQQIKWSEQRKAIKLVYDVEPGNKCCSLVGVLYSCRCASAHLEVSICFIHKIRSTVAVRCNESNWGNTGIFRPYTRIYHLILRMVMIGTFCNCCAMYPNLYPSRL